MMGVTRSGCTLLGAAHSQMSLAMPGVFKTAHEGIAMATIHRRVTRTGHVRYRAQVRIKNQPYVSATLRKRSDVDQVCWPDKQE